MFKDNTRQKLDDKNLNLDGVNDYVEYIPTLGIYPFAEENSIESTQLSGETN